MIAALNNSTNVNGPGASTGQSARVREADVYDPSTASQAEASAVVSLSPQATSLAASGTASPAQTPSAQTPSAQTAPAQVASTQTASVPAPAPAPAPAAPTTVTAQSTSFQPSNARAAVVSEDEKFPEPISLVPNLVYAEADSDQNGVISPSERRAYDVLHPTLGQRPADVPPKRVVEAELREYTSIANNQF
ncbi:hypothetical protein ACFJIX_28755 [Roseateles sp. UC29_93]|uniref:hypothetical protein n=1 Tax=Roseateles sp. UC29_93 TaxID=3350177 RepID=UPI00366FE519